MAHLPQVGQCASGVAGIGSKAEDDACAGAEAVLNIGGSVGQPGTKPVGLEDAHPNVRGLSLIHI